MSRRSDNLDRFDENNCNPDLLRRDLRQWVDQEYPPPPEAFFERYRESVRRNWNDLVRQSPEARAPRLPAACRCTVVGVLMMTNDLSPEDLAVALLAHLSAPAAEKELTFPAWEKVQDMIDEGRRMWHGR